MASIAFGSPSRYIQGAKEIDRLVWHTEKYGKRVFAIIDSYFFESLSPHLKKIYVGGDCRDELYSRLQKAGAPESIMEKVSDYQKLLEALKQDKRNVFILPNYTSMMEVRQALVQETGSKDFWE